MTVDSFKGHIETELLNNGLSSVCQALGEACQDLARRYDGIDDDKFIYWQVRATYFKVMAEDS